MNLLKRLIGQNNLENITKLSFVILIYAVTLNQVSFTFDADIGWHFRFAMDVLKGSFPYLDSYTWGYFGGPWVNTAWGGDVLYWLGYKYLGRFGLEMVLAAIFTSAFVLISKIRTKKITLIGLFLSLLAVFAVRHLIVLRLSLVTPLFFVFIIYSLEKIKVSRWYWFWPPVIWLWSAIHGSWLLAFPLIAIYFFGNLIESIFSKYFINFKDKIWTKKEYLKSGLLATISLCLIIINPYGGRLFSEMFKVFSDDNFKKYIIEWMPSYVYPIFIFSVILAVVVLIVAIFAFWKKKITVSQAMLVLTLFYTGMQEKRNIIFILLIGIPILTELIIYAKKELEKNKLGWFYDRGNLSMITALVIIATAYFTVNINFNNDLFQDKKTLEYTGIPFEAIDFFRNYEGREAVRIFNEFNWTGYLEWVIPENKVFVDGKIITTGRNPDRPNQTLLESYNEIMKKPDGLLWLEKNEVKFILLSNRNKLKIEPGLAEKYFYGRESVEEGKKIVTIQLEKDLKESDRWTPIYADEKAVIWEQKTRPE